MKKEIMNTVVKMTVAEMRKVASKYGIKNAKKYKRAELEQMLVEAMVEEAKSKTTKPGNKKAYKVSDDQVQALADVLTKNVIKKKVTAEELMQENRKVLIRVMKALKCKMWYRTYDKVTMVNKIVEAVA